MHDKLSNIVAWIVLMGIFYLLCSFIAWSFNPMSWYIFSEVAWIGRALFFVVGLFLVALLKTVNKYY
jgi:hypothetical protein